MKPNILLITADQLRCDAIGCYGNKSIQTPNLDRIAEEGVRFNNMHVASPVCAPNRCSIATGRYPSVHGLRANGIALPPGEVTLMKALRRAAYSTYGVGKMHFEPQWSYSPNDTEGITNAQSGQGAIDPQPKPWQMPYYGFDEVLLTEDHRVGPYAEYLRARGFDPWADPHSFTYPQSLTRRSLYPEEHHQTTWIANRTLELIERHPAKKPFFMWCSFVDPHHPFTPPAPYDLMYNPKSMPLPMQDPSETNAWPDSYHRFRNAREGSHEAVALCDFSDSDWKRIKAFYYGMVSLIDKQVGRMLEMLKDSGYLDNTIVVFTSDHGESLGDHHLLFKHGFYRCVTEVPFILRFPDGAFSGETRDRLCSSIDIMPTLLEALGIELPAGIQGKSMMSLLSSPTSKLRDDLLIESPCHRRTIRTLDFRMTWHGRAERGELYDLKKDPNEFTNLWDDAMAGGLKSAMMDKLVDLLSANTDPLPVRATIC